MMNANDFFEQYQRAAHTRSKDEMTALYHRDAELFDMWNAYHLHGIGNIRNMINQWFDSLGDEKLAVDFSDIKVKQDNDVAFAYAFVHFRALDAEGKILRQMKNRMTIGLIKEEGSWCVIHQHTSIPISTENLQGMFE